MFPLVFPSGLAGVINQSNIVHLHLPLPFLHFLLPIRAPSYTFTTSFSPSYNSTTSFSPSYTSLPSFSLFLHLPPLPSSLCYTSHHSALHPARSKCHSPADAFWVTGARDQSAFLLHSARGPRIIGGIRVANLAGFLMHLS
ncbi:hypothetical protein Pmani_028207 [Petrolisthes manimaculis]|uniref:Uncharacterized protein n=1 Tax=Petrolisthes manimaculis TaxID=1843537 RepID=A0AAE1TVX9_9EUCA|nr:hypothetical protein Pmani_028207 [Petrolisthes manimaculis]